MCKYEVLEYIRIKLPSAGSKVKRIRLCLGLCKLRLFSSGSGWVWLKKLRLRLYIFVNFVCSLNLQYENWKYIKIYWDNHTNSVFNLFCWIDFVVCTVISCCRVQTVQCSRVKSLQATQHCSERIKVELSYNYNCTFPEEYTSFCKAFFILHRNTIKHSHCLTSAGAFINSGQTKPPELR